MLHTSVLLSLAVCSVAAFLPPNYINYGQYRVPEGTPEEPGNKGPNGEVEQRQQPQPIQIIGAVITFLRNGTISITKNGQTIFTNCRVCRLCCVGPRTPGNTYVVPGPGAPNPNPGNPIPGPNGEYARPYYTQSTASPGPQFTTPLVLPNPMPTFIPRGQYPVPPAENVYGTAPPVWPCVPVTTVAPGTTQPPTQPITRAPCQPVPVPQTTTTPVPHTYPTSPVTSGYATSPTYPTAPTTTVASYPTAPTYPTPPKNSYAVPEVVTIPTIAPTWPTYSPTTQTPVTFPTFQPTQGPIQPTRGPSGPSGPNPSTSCCYVELRNIQATVSCGTIGTKCCHQTCSNQRSITVSVPFPVFNLPSKIPCAEAVQRGIVREIDILGVCNESGTTPGSPGPAPTAGPIATPFPTPYPTPYATEATVTVPWTQTQTPAPGTKDAYVVPTPSSSGSIIGAFLTLIIATVLCL